MKPEDLPYAYGQPGLVGDLRSQASDFYVEEQLGFEPDGEGEHHFIWLEKVGLNTEQVARALARFAAVPARQVSYSGMKDRHAVTRQWFSVHLPGKKDYDWAQLNDGQLSILRATRHGKKLRRGTHRGNGFRIRLRNVSGDLAELESRLQRASNQGVPNYFGEQRFGHAGANLEKGRRWLAGEWQPKRHQRGIYLSALRSWLFNEVLAHRVEQQNWQQLLPGELIALDGSHSIFAHNGEADLPQRLALGDIHPTGPMYGKITDIACENEAAALEESILKLHAEVLVGLEKAGLNAQRRPLRVIPAQLDWTTFPDHSVEITFSLPTGCFATALMRELIHYRVVDTGPVVDKNNNRDDSCGSSE